VPELWGALGYDTAAIAIATAMRDGAEISLIQGPPGVGKSWLAKSIGSMWESGNGGTVVAEGDALRSDIAYYPLGLAMAGLTSGWRALGPSLADAARAGESLLGSAGIITVTIQAMSKLRPSRRRARAMYLNDTEQSVLYDLERIGHKRPLLLVADNLHWWDAASLEFLGRLRHPRMTEAFPFLADMRILAVETPEPYQRVAAPAAHDALLAIGQVRRFELPRVSRDGFEDVLVALGASDPPTAAVADAVYTLSGGHLALASRCAARMAAGEADVFLAARNADDFLRLLLTERVRSLGALGSQAVALLQIAAIVGQTFRRDEVTCASPTDEATISRVLRHCRDEDVLELDDGVGRFVHDLYRQHFLESGDSDRTEIHARLSTCLQLLRPAEYDVRCLNALDAERPRDAAALAGLAALQRERDGWPWREMATPVLAVITQAGLDGAIDRMSAALEDLNSYRFQECLAALDRLPRDLPRSLLAEADYLRAMCLMSTRSEEDRAQGRAILEAWDGLAEEEPELGIRLMQLLLYGLTHLRDKDPGRRFEGRLRQVLIDRVSFDAAAKDALYILDRCAGSLYQPDVAVVRNQEAAEHFGPAPDQEVVRRPLEYYRCLVNLGAALICNGRYVEAREVYRRVHQLIAQYPAGTFPRVDYPRMNALLAEYRLGALAIGDAVVRQQKIAAEKADGDPFYVENALAVYLALAGRFDEAIRIFDSLDACLTQSRTDPEPNMAYLIRANRCATRFLAGDVTYVTEEWASLTPLVDRIPYVTRPMLVRRHELLTNVVAGRQRAPQDFDESLITGGPMEFGPLWENYGRGFRMPEVEFWREN
jgi:tetratricopeptide (TPR) repeat protein